MNIAVIKNNICINTLVFDDMESAQLFLEQGHIEGDTVAELPEEYGIGDIYKNNKWKKAESKPEYPEMEIARLMDELSAEDWREIQHIRELYLEIPTSMSDDEYLEWQKERQSKVERIRELRNLLNNA